MITDSFYRAEILWRMVFDAPSLFAKINTLPWYQATLLQWLNTVACTAGDSLLEIGCATGELSQLIAHRGLAVHAVDKSPRMIARARLNNLAGVTYAQADATRLVFADRHFDTVVAASLINSVPNPLQVLMEMKRVCRQHGMISVLVANNGFTDKAALNLVTQLGLTGFSRAALVAWHQNAKKMSLADMTRLFDKANLPISSHSEYLDGMVLTITAVRQD